MNYSRLTKPFNRLLLLVGYLLIDSQHAQALVIPSIEAQVTQYVSAKQPEQLALLEQLVNINSGTANIEGVRQVGNLLKQQFDQLGFKTTWAEEPATMHRGPTLIARHEGHQGKRLLLIGHLDTVFSIDSPFQHFERHKDTATGPGVVDDKGGDVVILYALKALKAAHALDTANITVVLTGDEEDSGKPTAISRKPLIDAAKNADIALDFELAMTADTATVARRGITNWMIETQGQEAHSSDISQNHVGDGAIYELARILNALRIEQKKEAYLSINPGMVLGGTQLTYDKNNAHGAALGRENIVAKTALAIGDLRFMTEKQKLAAENTIKRLVANHLPETQATVTFQDGIPSMPPTPQNITLLNQYSAVSTQLGYGPVKAIDPKLRGAGDISHIAAFVTSALSGLGPVGTGTHSEKETLNIPSLTMQTARTAVLIYQLIT